MTREKEIKEAALNHRKGFGTSDNDSVIGAFENGMHNQSFKSFIIGAEWADKNPTTDNKGCKFCQGDKTKEYKCLGRSRKGHLKYGYEESTKPVDFGETCDLTIIDNILHVDYNAYSCDSSFNDEITIYFCPFCGRKLK